MRALLFAVLVLASTTSGQGGPVRRDLAGKSLTRFPHFQFTRSFNEGQPIQIAFDPKNDLGLAKRTVDVFVVDHGELGEFRLGKKLSSLTGRPLTVKLTQGGVLENTFLLDTGTLKGGGGTALGRGYDVVVDVNLNATLDAGDVLDGSSAEAGFYVVQDFVTFKREASQETGPFPVLEVLYAGGGQYQREDIYYPANVAELGELPLVVVSHGNGHDYRWYDHIGYHLASWGYVVMSHANNTGPGIESASVTTLKNTNLFLGSLEVIAGGALLGHVDGHRIVWIGHSRGGEGVVRAYRRLLEGDPLATLFGPADIQLVSSIAPTDFMGAGRSDVGSVTYHLWTGGADRDVNGCANCDICQTFHLLERADGTSLSTSLHGAGHGDFHDGGGSSVAQGPCLIRRTKTHTIMRGTLLPLVQFALDGNPACLDYLTRQYEEFRPLGALSFDDACVTVDLMYRPAPSPERFVIDDFQSQPDRARSSSGAGVLASAQLLLTLFEGRLDDVNGAFTASDTDRMNGMTLAGPGDPSAGTVLEWNQGDEYLAFEVPAGQRDLTDFTHLSFRAAQAARHPLTVPELGDLDFEVQLTDAGLRSSTISIGAYGGGIEEPYQRGGCGMGQGWANEFETLRIPLADFRRDGTPLDLSNVAAVTLLFGPSHGSPAGRIGLDEIEFTRE